MPELPEVETTRQGIAPYIAHQTVRRVDVRNPRLRWRVPARLERELPGQRIESVHRRAKYILLKTGIGTVIIHLGMSGSLRILQSGEPPRSHDHVDLMFGNGLCLRYRDPRRFGCVLWCRNPEKHRLLRSLGPEPLGPGFDGDYLYNISRTRPGPVKNLLMNARVVSGIGNIYASEALFAARIHPTRRANNVSLVRYQRLARETRRILSEAVSAGGTTLRDFQRADGQPGYFRYALQVYGRTGMPCPRCGAIIRKRDIQQRSSFYCPRCQR